MIKRSPSAFSKTLCLAVIATTLVGVPAPANATSVFDFVKSIVTAPTKVIKGVRALQVLKSGVASKRRKDLAWQFANVTPVDCEESGCEWAGDPP
jgi:hypothetical protein